MANKASFTAEEWAVLRDTPHLVGMAISGAGGGVMGAVKEAFSVAQVMAGQASSSNELLKSLCTTDEVKAAEAGLRQAVMADPANAAAKLKALALENAGKAMGILSQKSAADVDAYKGFIGSIADSAAKAAKEGGFLGFGGQQVSEGEQNILSALTTALSGGSVLGAAGSVINAAKDGIMGGLGKK